MGFPLLLVIARIARVTLITLHAVRGKSSGQPLATQLRHPAQGPVAVLIPVTGMLLGADLTRAVPWAGRLLVGLAVAAAAIFAVWLVTTWLDGHLALEVIHGGYLLPTVAASLVGPTPAPRSAGWRRPGLFGVGLFFWVVMTTLILLRLAIRPALPGPLVPTMAIITAPPPVAGIAFFTLGGHHPGMVSDGLAALAVLFVLVQVALLTRYRRLEFSLGFWSFTFPSAAVAGYPLEWLDLRAFPGRTLIAALTLGAVTVLIGAIAARSLPIVERRVTRTPALDALTAADDADVPAQLEKVTS